MVSGREYLELNISVHTVDDVRLDGLPTGSGAGSELFFPGRVGSYGARAGFHVYFPLVIGIRLDF